MKAVGVYEQKTQLSYFAISPYRLVSWVSWRNEETVYAASRILVISSNWSAAARKDQ